MHSARAFQALAEGALANQIVEATKIGRTRSAGKGIFDVNILKNTVLKNIIDAAMHVIAAHGLFSKLNTEECKKHLPRLDFSQNYMDKKTGAKNTFATNILDHLDPNHLPVWHVVVKQSVNMTYFELCGRERMSHIPMLLMISVYVVMTKHRDCSSIDRPLQSLFDGGRFVTPDTAVVGAPHHKDQPRNTLYLVKEDDSSPSEVDACEDLALSNGTTTITHSTIAHRVFKQTMRLPPNENAVQRNKKIVKRMACSEWQLGTVY